MMTFPIEAARQPTLPAVFSATFSRARKLVLFGRFPHVDVLHESILDICDFPLTKSRCAWMATWLPRLVRLSLGHMHEDTRPIYPVQHGFSGMFRRPEVRFEYTSGAKAYDNGTKRDQFTVSADMIIRF
jgi:hypothetical protein